MTPAVPSRRWMTNPRLLAFALLIGIAGGVIATGYYAILQLILRGTWVRLAGIGPASLTIEPAWNPAVLAITTFGGLLVGVLTRYLGSAGEIASVVDNIHVHHGKIDMRQTPAMTATSLVGIGAGGSAGPEAPLVQIIGSCASWLGVKLKLDGGVIRTFTFCGMGAALGAFFGAPLGGALFALEIPHRRGMEYFEALLPALVAAVAAFLVFRSCVGYEHILFHLDGPSHLTLKDVWWGIAFGALGAGVASVFAILFRAIGKLAHRWHAHPVMLATVGGLLIGLLAQLAPMSLFWGEYQIDTILHSGDALRAHHTLYAAAGLLLMLTFIKMLAIGVTLHSGFRGGFIFPLMFVGACVGTAIHVLFPGVPAPVAIVATMAAVNVAVTKTPISTSVILVTLTGTSMMPVIITASLVGLLLTTRLNLIHTQRGRSSPPVGLQPASTVAPA